jgi:hypothetical protein
MPPRASLRTTAKSLPEHARGNNRSLVLQTLYSDGAMSRADLARATGLTRVTISDLVAELLGEALVVEQGTRDEARPGKPATLVDIDRAGFRILGIDLSAHDAFRGALLDLDGGIHHRVVAALDGATGEAAIAKVIDLARELIAQAEVPILGVGIGSPGVVDLAGVVLTAPNLGWHDVPLQDRLAVELDHPVLVANDANVAALAEHSFGGALSDTMLVKIGNGVGAGLLVGGTLLSGAGRSATSSSAPTAATRARAASGGASRPGSPSRGSRPASRPPRPSATRSSRGPASGSALHSPRSSGPWISRRSCSAAPPTCSKARSPGRLSKPSVRARWPNSTAI